MVEARLRSVVVGGSDSSPVEPQKSDIGEEATLRTKRTLLGPSNIKRVEHEDANHRPHIDWCHDCVRGRGVAYPHVSTKAKQEADDREHREVCMDYFFTGEVKASGATLFAVRSRRCGSTLAMVMPTKGLPEQWVGGRVAKAIDSMDQGSVLLTSKSDGGPSIKALRDAVAHVRRSETKVGCMEKSNSRGDSAGNAVTEKACQEIGGR